MKEENKKNKKKVLLTYLILAICLLVIAAITLTVIFTVKKNPSDIIVDAPNVQEPDNSGNTDDNKDKDKDKDDVPTVNETGYKIPVKNAVVSTSYEIAHNTTTNQIRYHQGLDFIAEAGTEVFAIADGTVTKLVTNSKIGENYITVTHADGMTSTYKYIDVLEGIEVGDTVKRGETLGTIAVANGYEIHEGSHLHFEINVKGRNVDPETYLDLDVK